MLFKYNSDNTKQLHNAAIKCLENIKMYVTSSRCIGYTEDNGTLNVMISKDKKASLCKPQGISLYYMTCSVSEHKVAKHKEISNILKAVIRNKIVRASVDHRVTAPTADFEFYILIDESKIHMITKEHLCPVNNISTIGKIILCKPLSVSKGTYSLDLYFDEEEALKEFGGLKNAIFTRLDITPTTKKLQSTKCSHGYSQLSEEHNQHETSSTTINIKNITTEEIPLNEQGATGGIIQQPQQLTHTEAVAYGISFFNNVSAGIEKLCNKYPFMQ
ncbi:hypothetical protein EHRUM4_06490 [Ehrlichia ruminantium]|uniref:DUF3023 domain-containing protein n=1 Tax=Ehrlichia ruminantium TaxID=779 RepID=UPI0007C140BE|nr:DUF3023 domain-containing protein [Ehrlichia ruminantium]GAT75429.1 hypothetical protein EHRUM4_06490 [Ehrlichia ruminantium]